MAYVFMKYEITECKLPKGHKWSDGSVIKEPSPYGVGSSYGKYCCFYPIGDDLYIKGMFSKFIKEERKIKNVVVKLPDYKSLTANQACEILTECISAYSMIRTVWNKLGLRQGYMVPILKDLN